MKLSLFFTVTIGFILLAAASNEQPSKKNQSGNFSNEIERKLRDTIEQAIVSQGKRNNARWWKELGSNAPSVIIKMYNESASRLEKIRLIEALGHYDLPNGVNFLKGEVARTKNNVIRQVAIRSLSRSQGIKEIEFYLSLLSHHDPHTRLEAALSLKRTNDPNALMELRHFTSNEKTEWLVKRLEKEGITGQEHANDYTPKTIPPNAHIVRDLKQRQ